MSHIEYQVNPNVVLDQLEQSNQLPIATQMSDEAQLLETFKILQATQLATTQFVATYPNMTSVQLSRMNKVLKDALSDALVETLRAELPTLMPLLVDHINAETNLANIKSGAFIIATAIGSFLATYAMILLIIK